MYERVIDKISQLNFYKDIDKMDKKAKHKHNEYKKNVESGLNELKDAFSVVQIKFKESLSFLQSQETEIRIKLEEKYNDNSHLFESNGYINTSAKDNAQGLIKMVKECLQNKKINLLGCKMKIYQERLRQIQFIEILCRFKEVKNYESI